MQASVSCWVAALVSAVRREVSPPSLLAALTPCHDGRPCQGTCQGRAETHSAAGKGCRARGGIELRQTKADHDTTWLGGAARHV